MSSCTNLTLAIPALLWPRQHDALASLSLSGLNALCRSGQYSAQSCSRSQFYRRFLWQGSWLEQAKKTLGVEPATPCLIAAPLSQTTGMHQVQCEYGHNLNIQMEEAQAFCRTLSDWFMDDEWRFLPLSADLWLVCLPQQPDFTAPSILDIHGVLDITTKPQGRDAGRLLQKQTELQMLLYRHPLNQRRIARGLAPIGDVWLQNDSSGSADDTVTLYSNSHWASHARPVPASWAELRQQCPPDGSAVIFMEELCPMADCGDVFAYIDLLQQWETSWWQPLWQSYRKRQIKQLTISCDGHQGGSMVVRRHWRSWFRRTRPSFDGYTL